MAEPNRGRPLRPYPHNARSRSHGSQEDQEARACATPDSYPAASSHVQQHASEQVQYLYQPRQENPTYEQTLVDNTYAHGAAGVYALRRPNPAGTHYSGQQSPAASFQSDSASSHHPVAGEAGGHVPAAAVTPQQPSSLGNWDPSRSNEQLPQSLPGELFRLRIDGPQETLQQGSPQQTAGRGRGIRRRPSTQPPPMQHADRGRQAQAAVTCSPPLQSQPACTSGLQKYGTQSSFHHGNAATGNQPRQENQTYEQALVAGGYALRQPNPAGTHYSGQQNSAASFQSDSASSHHPVAGEAGGYVPAATPQQPSSLNRTLGNWNSSRSTGQLPQSLPDDPFRLRIDGPQETLQQGSPHRTAGRGRGIRRGPSTQRPPMQHAVRGRQAQAAGTCSPLVQSQPATSALQRYGTESSFHRGNAPPAGLYSGFENRWPPAAPSGTAASNYSSSSGSSRSGPRRASCNSSNESRVVERNRPGISQEPSQGQSLMRREGASSSLDQGSPSATSATDRSSSTTPTLLVKANHFKLDLNKKLVVYHYEVTIWWGAEDPPSETDAKQRLASRDKRRILAEFASSTLDMNNPIFDGQKSLYSIKPLELEGETKIVSVRREICEIRDEFYVRIRQVDMLRYDSQHYSRKQAQALDIAIRCALSQDRDCLGRLLLRKVPKEPAPQKQLTTPQYRAPTVRGRYSQQRGDPPAKTDDAENPGEATYSGILTSVRSGQYEMFVNADTILTSFYEDGPLLNYVEALLGRQLGKHPQLEEAEIKDLNTKLHGFKVCVKHLRYTRSRKIKQITKKGANEIAVTEAQTVAKYFDETYKKLDHPSLPCVEVESKKGKCYYPLEMCFIPLGQRGELSQSGKPVTPSVKFKRAEAVARELAVRREDILGEFFTSISTSPVKCNAKVFPKVDVDDLKSAMGVVPWAILNMSKFNTVSDVAKLKKNLIAQGIRQGIILDLKAKIANHNNPDLVDILEELKAVEFLVIILDSKKSVYYNKLKNDAETKLGLITQCVAVDKSKFSDGSIGGNLIRKIKAKLGFVDKAMPRTIDGFNCEDVLVMGADVSHHGPNDPSPSVAAVVASIDGRASRYVAVIRPQARTDGNTRVEIISNIESMAKELFRQYRGKNPKKYPEHILFYRDGVSEGEFSEVYKIELQNLRSACTEVLQCNPRITFVTVQKRHRTRFCLADGSYRNVPQGTVVDKTITQHAKREFFMCSHTPIRGTARPAHYRVIYDDKDFEPETLQKITFSLCHMYARCVTPVSIPAPVYYAHLAAARASCYMKATEQVDTNPINVVGNCRDKMFFI